MLYLLVCVPLRSMMEISKSKRMVLAMPSRWPPIAVGVVLSLFISAILTCTFGTLIVPLSESASSTPAISASPWSSSPASTVVSVPNQFLTFIIRKLYLDKVVTHAGTSVADIFWDFSSQSADHSSPSFAHSFAPTTNLTETKPRHFTYERGTVLKNVHKNSSLPPQEGVQSSSEESESSSDIIFDVKVEPFPNGTSSTVRLNSTSPTTLSASPPTRQSEFEQCDISIGKWVMDDSYPLYLPDSCPFVDEAFNCQRNGRPDSRYMRWRWAPRDCTIPRFNGTDLLERLRKKRLVFVGDSLSRNQWESMLCMLRESLVDKRRIVQITGGRISKLPGAYVFKFLDYDCKLEFYTSHYLVDQVGLNQSNYRVRLDKMDKSERRWRKADVLVFNTGHWWTADKIGEGDDRFQERRIVHKRLNISIAYQKALSTWADWVNAYVNPSKTTVFFRGYSPVHYIGGQWNSGGQCQDETEPIFDESFLVPYPNKMQVLDTILQAMPVPVQVLNITRLSDFRKDAHPAIYGHSSQLLTQHQDCSHWCLPGLPDIWNELLYSALTYKSY
ncbi:hypothetical protein KP509_38G021300 [Ceratopteris richardii]|uniref:Trichome birefringence-like N-terminal domain-containing protein n=1 Tax=Ceratopteris richardii TaxID=49495 RepID=A0A8T2Q351_CERRI|nr:hypothetical protein KP509_38G021300 [Ceratopteris richardii]